MDKMKDIHPKKSLIRNSEKPIPKCKVMTTQSHPPASKENVSGRIPVKSVNIAKGPRNNFDSPELYSSLKLSKQIDNIRKPRKSKSCSDVLNKKLAVDEKISRRVNFPYSQPIFKDLIPLTCSQTQHQPVASSRDQFHQKDKEPQLSDYVIPKNIPSYYCLSTVKMEIKPTFIASNNLKLYNQLEIDW